MVDTDVWESLGDGQRLLRGVHGGLRGGRRSGAAGAYTLEGWPWRCTRFARRLVPTHLIMYKDGVAAGRRFLPAPLAKRQSHPGVTRLAVAARTVALSLLLPLVVAAAFVIHFATGWTTFEREDLEFGVAFLSSLLIVVWPASIPLSLALILLHRRSRLASYLCGALLIPPSIVGFIVAGLLQSEFFVILVAALSLPAWIVLLAVTCWCSRARSSVPA